MAQKLQFLRFAIVCLMIVSHAIALEWEIAHWMDRELGAVERHP